MLHPSTIIMAGRVLLVIAEAEDKVWLAEIFLSRILMMVLLSANDTLHQVARLHAVLLIPRRPT